mgnify:CR=1 FL=1
MSTALGNHILVEFMNCDPHIMNDVAAIERDMVDAAKKAEATVINSTFHHFSPYGVSGVVVIQESHLAIHTWPEYLSHFRSNNPKVPISPYLRRTPP